MPLTNFPGGLASFGVPLIGSGPTIPPTSGKYWFVNSATGKDQNGRGTDQDTPFASLVYAVTKARASKADVIILAANHAESIATATYMDVSKAGLTVVGMGNGAHRPTFTLTTLVGATFKVSGAECTFDNVIFNLIGFDNVTIGMTITGDGCTFKNCRFVGNDATKSVATGFSVSGARFTLQSCVWDGTGADTGTAAVIASGAAIDQLHVIGCDIRANASVAIFSSTGANHITNLLVAYSFCRQSNGTAKNIFNLTTSSTGLIAYNVFNGTTWATAADVASNSTSTSLRWFENYGFDDGAGAVSGVLVPAVGTIA